MALSLVGRLPDTINYRRAEVRVALDGARVGVWVIGEHDRSNADLLLSVLGGTAVTGDRDVVVDLGATDFIDASTVRALIRGREFLVARGHSMTVRSPRPLAHRVLEICGLAELVEPACPIAAAGQRRAVALESWVEVRPAERDDVLPADSGRV